MSFKEKAYSSVSLVSAGSLANAVLGFLFLTGVAKVLSLSDFGHYALLTGLLTLISKVLDFGTNSLFVASHEDNQKLTTGFIETKIILLLIAFPITFLSFGLLGIYNINLLLIFILGLFAYGLNYTLYALYQRSEKYLQLVALNGVPAAIKGLFGLLLYLHIVNFDLDQSFMIFSLSIFTGLIVWLISPLSEYTVKLSAKINVRSNLQTLSDAVSPGISQLIYESWQTLNNVLIKIFNTFTDIGIFSMANKISNIFTLVSISIFTVLLPKNAKRKKAGAARYDFRESAILSVGVLTVSFIMILISGRFLHTIFEDKFNESLKYLDVLILAGAISAIQNFFENYFFVEKKTNYLLMVNSLKIGLLLVLAVILIPVYGLYSLAMINLVTASAGLIFLVALITKHEFTRG